MVNSKNPTFFLAADALKGSKYLLRMASGGVQRGLSTSYEGTKGPFGLQKQSDGFWPMHSDGGFEPEIPQHSEPWLAWGRLVSTLASPAAESHAPGDSSRSRDSLSRRFAEKNVAGVLVCFFWGVLWDYAHWEMTPFRHISGTSRYFERFWAISQGVIPGCNTATLGIVDCSIRAVFPNLPRSFL